MSQSELARRTGRPFKTINEIVNAKAALTPDTAIQLERTLGISASFWNNLETDYREHLAFARAQEELEANAPWADAFPIRDLVRHGLVRAGLTKSERLAALLQFFRVSSPGVWESQWLAPTASLRASAAFNSSPHAVAAWLRWGEIIAEQTQSERFDRQSFIEALNEVRKLTRREPFTQILGQVRELCAAAGVVIVLAPELGKTRLSGAAHWLASDKAIIQLSLRYKSDDQFWFSFFHEAGHLLSRKRDDHVDAEDGSGEDADREEQAANAFARDFLMPADAYVEFVSAGTFSAQAVRDFAKQLDIAPGIVVGRMQRDGLVDHSHLNGLKKSIRWAR
jgi:addiction module HigA family antidote